MKKKQRDETERRRQMSKKNDEVVEWYVKAEEQQGICQLCGCSCALTKHHLVPQSKCKNKYKQIREDSSNHIWVCRQCHDHIHATYDNSWLRDNLDTLDKLLADEKIMAFADWKKKHPNFNGHAKMSNNHKSKQN